MDKNKEFVARKLFSIRKKHLEYFKVNNCRIFTCVVVNWIKPISLHVINKDLPDEITYDLEEIFWMSDTKVDTCESILIELRQHFRRSEKLAADFKTLSNSFSIAYEKRKKLVERIFI